MRRDDSEQPRAVDARFERRLLLADNDGGREGVHHDQPQPIVNKP